jgi:hypothetical protein
VVAAALAVPVGLAALVAPAQASGAPQATGADQAEPTPSGAQQYQAAQTMGAADSPINVPSDFLMGVQTHIGHASLNGGPGIRTTDGWSLAKIATAELGANSVRDEIFWNEFYWYDGARAQQIADWMNVAPQNGGKLLLDLGTQAWDVLGSADSPALTSEGFPDEPGERAAFAAYASAVIDLVGADNLAGLEIWNEWNAYSGWIDRPGGIEGTPTWSGNPICPTDPTQGRGCPQQYVELVAAVAPVIRAKAPNVPLIVGATSAYDEDWTKAVLAGLKALDVAIDGFSIHPYVTHANGCGNWVQGGYDYSPAAVISCIQQAQATVASYYPGVPLYVTEVGWSTNVPGFLSTGQQYYIDDNSQGAYLVETYVRGRALEGVAGIWWYDLRDDYISYYLNGTWQEGYRIDAAESNFGLYEWSGTQVTNYNYGLQSANPGAAKIAAGSFQTVADFWDGCSDPVGAAAPPNRVFTLDCPAGPRKIIVTATAAELDQALADGWTLVDLHGTAPDITPGGPQTGAWLAGHTIGLKNRQISTPPAIGAVTLSGSPQVGQTLTLAVTGVTPAGATVTRVWYKGTSVIAGATGTSYQLTAAEAGQDICVKVTATFGGQTVTKYSNHLIVPQALSLTQPVLTGQALATARVSVAAPASPAGAAVTYQWFRDTSLIAGVSASSYTLTAADGGKAVKVKVTATYGGQSVTKYSNALYVLGISRLEVTGTARVGNTLQVDARYEPSDAAWEVKWYRGTSVVGTGLTYRLQAADAGQDLVVKATVTKAGLGSVSKYSAHFWPTS